MPMAMSLFCKSSITPTLMHMNMLNEFMTCKCSTTPTVGMMGTMFVGSDRYMAVCVKVLSPKKVIVHTLGDYNVKKVDGIDYYDGDVSELYNQIVRIPDYIAHCKDAADIEEYLKYKINQHTYSFRKNHRWMPKGQDAYGTCSIHWGYADEYLDPCF